MTVFDKIDEGLRILQKYDDPTFPMFDPRSHDWGFFVRHPLFGRMEDADVERLAELGWIQSIDQKNFRAVDYNPEFNWLRKWTP